MKTKLLLIALFLSSIALGQINTDVFRTNIYGDVSIRRYASGDLTFKRALVPGYNTTTQKASLIINYAGDFADGISVGGNKFIVNDGSVGIGTTSPIDKLTIDEGNITLGNTTKQEYNIIFRPSDNSWRSALIGYSSNVCSEDYIGLKTKYGSIRFITNNGNEVVRVTDSENVGIGTTNPSHKLDVNGSFRVINGNSILNFNSYSDLIIRNSTRGDGGRAVVHGGDNTLLLNCAGDFSGGTKLGVNVKFAANSGVSYINTGNVGIGTTSPQYKLAVNGTIGAKEVVVKTDIETPDYVFEENYNLKSLEEVEQFIKANKHLPEIPSATEVDANGVGLAEMNMLLLKKVEELTLYTLKQEKKIDKQNNEIKQLKIENKQLRFLDERISNLERENDNEQNK